MPRIVGVDIPNNKRIEIALTYIYGIGVACAKDILREVGIDFGKRAKDLTEDELSRLGSAIEKNYVVEGQLRRQVGQNISRLRDIKCYRGTRHRRGLPVRGQRTKTNARTKRGKKVTVGSGRKRAAEKT